MYHKMLRNWVYSILINGNVCFIILILCSLSHSSEEIDNFYADGIRSLSELPMKRLIELRLSMASDYEDEPNEVTDAKSRTFSMALPSKRVTTRPIKRYEHWEEKGKDSKVSKIFQLTVTSLSFLAFGGYLLTLIITAIKRNANNMNGGNVIVLSNIRRPKRRIVIHDPMDNVYDTENLYRGMIMLSHNYAMYN